jgi:hypothetical protein
MNKAILIMPIIAILLGITTSMPTTVQAHTGDGFMDGYNRARHDYASNHEYNISCSANSEYCEHYKAGYEIAWNQVHWWPTDIHVDAANN